MASAMEWVAKITTVGLEMVLPGVGGRYLDAWLGTSYLTLLGLGLGMAVAIFHLVQWTKLPPDPPLPADELNANRRQESTGERTGKQ